MKKLTATQVAAIRATFKANMNDLKTIAKYGELVDNARASIEGAEMRVQAITGGHTSADFFEAKKVVATKGNSPILTKTGEPVMKTVIVLKEVLPEDVEMPEKKEVVVEA